ncbi:hypothetical protein NM688_g9456 [Phlebia brevispora]|uniref:Uncharacterized protein n=1 Tax=Phlebia brevispora TaxID=194682 RepID=A0ACC1RJ16_9APHY|nr:hypothetical protein NM688_g9456 [Phlebia brevispora]
MPPKKWLIIDRERGIDQEAWLYARCADLRTSQKPLKDYARDVAHAFESQFPSNILQRIFKNGKFQRFETEEEAIVRCEGRPKQCVKWIQNHKSEILRRAEHQASLPAYLDLQDYKPDVEVKRARSARDIYVGEHPEIRENATKEARDSGISTRSELQSSINAAYSAAIAVDPDWQRYIDRSQEEKTTRAAERAKIRESSTIADDDSQPGMSRTQILQNLEYTLLNTVKALARRIRRLW